MKKFVLLALVLISANMACGQILYSISGNGAKGTSYIVGTHHLTDAKFVSQIKGIDKAMKKAKQVYGELDMSLMTNLDTMAMMQKAMMLPDQMTIRDLLDDNDYAKLNNFFEKAMGMPFDSETIFNSLGRMRPSAIETQIFMILYLMEHPMAFDPNNAIDAYFQNTARAAKKEVHALESYEFQIELMYNSNPIEEEIKSLMCTLDNFDKAIEQLNCLTEAYLNQNAEEIEKSLYMSKEIECSDFEAINNLIYKRNATWIENMPKIMKGKPTLFVVGAGHLFGDKGVLKLLQKAGYTIKAVE